MVASPRGPVGSDLSTPSAWLEPQRDESHHSVPCDPVRLGDGITRSSGFRTESSAALIYGACVRVVRQTDPRSLFVDHIFLLHVLSLRPFSTLSVTI